MFTFLLIILDVLLIAFFVLELLRFVRVIFMRAKCIAVLKLVCKKCDYVLKMNHSPWLSVFFKSRKIDFSVSNEKMTYYIKFLTFFSPKKVCHFIDSNSYICYLKSFFALPMATKVSEYINLISYHRLPTFVKESREENEIYILLCNPTPNEITYIGKDGSKQVAGNGSTIGFFNLYNVKGFCELLSMEQYEY